MLIKLRCVVIATANRAVVLAGREEVGVPELCFSHGW
jgi:hypothetical protein